MIRKAKEIGVDFYLCDVTVWKNYLLKWYYKNISFTTRMRPTHVRPRNTFSSGGGCEMRCVDWMN